MPITTPRITEADIEASRHCAEHPHFDATEKAALIRTYVEQNFAELPHPLALIYKRTPAKKRLGGYNLHYIGTPSGIAEAALIRTALSILSEEGFQNMRFDLNCIGDKESHAVYERELGGYLKKSTATISEPLKMSLKEDVFNLFRREEEEAIQLRAGAPASIAYLSTASRLHFKEVLEFIEGLDIEFTLAPELIGEKNHASHTIFAIRPSGAEAELSSDPNRFLAIGYRYSRLSKRLGFKKELPMASVSIFTDKDAPEKRVYKELPRPKFYLVQLGREAKIKTLTLLELLRSHKIPVHHFLGKDKLTAQLTSAETLRVSYLILIGHKEALDGTATIRNMQTRAQDTIPMSQLPLYLKKISL